MEHIMKKWGLLAKTVGIVLGLLVVKILIALAGWEVFPLNTLVTAFIGAVIFTLAIIFTGTLVDYKESEKIPGELATSLRSLSDDFSIVPLTDRSIVHQARSRVYSLLEVICTNFRSNSWDIGKVHEEIRKINHDIHVLAGLNIAPPLLVKMRMELTAIDRISNRISTIATTSFIPTAYAISELAIGAVVVVLLFMKADTLLLGAFLFAAISVLTIGLLLLIKDMDNPFEVGAGTYADVNLDILWRLERELKDDQD